jgi:hypothetical protein
LFLVGLLGSCAYRNIITRGDVYNISTRTLKDHLSVLNVDEPGEDGLYGLHQLEITGGYTGTDSLNSIDLHGFDIEVLSDSRLRFWMVNHRPPIDDFGNYLDATQLGANSTVEVFDHTIGSLNLHFVKTVYSPAVYTPNNIASTGDGGFVSTNDHSTKTGTVSSFSRIFLLSTAYLHLHSSAHSTRSSAAEASPSAMPTTNATSVLKRVFDFLTA